MSTFLRSLVAIGLLLGVAPITTLAQEASDPLCGAIIEEDLVLDHDVICHNTSGPAIGAEGITINLNGKAIRCRNGSSANCRGSGAIGIDASRVRYVAIQGPGTITGFDFQLISGVTPRGSRRLVAAAKSSGANARRPAGSKSETADSERSASSKSRTDKPSN